LPVTYDQFVEHGIHRLAIGPALRELTKLGFVEITREGYVCGQCRVPPIEVRSGRLGI
jgi:hypothetical protein